MKPSAAKRAAKAEAENLCYACLEPLDATRTIRHNHERCYHALRRVASEAGKSMDQFEAEGKLGPSKPGRKPSNPVTIDARN